MSAQPRADARRIAPGHTRLPRVVEVNEPTPAPDVEDADRYGALLTTAFPGCIGPRVLWLLNRDFDRVVPYDVLSMEIYGQPYSEALYKLFHEQMSGMRRKFAQCGLNYRIITVRNHGYRLTCGDPRLDLPPGREEARADGLARYDRLKKRRPTISINAAAHVLRIPRTTLKEWLDKRDNG